MHMQWIPGLLSSSLLPPIRRPGDEAILSSPLSIELPTIVGVDDYTPASDFLYDFGLYVGLRVIID